jgi:hypothetical protein
MFRNEGTAISPMTQLVAFLENTALWKNHIIETIGPIGIKGLGVESLHLPSQMYFFYSN